MSWQDRVAPYIALTSPSGKHFEPKWKGGERSLEKKLGIFEYPRVAGAVVQDMDVSATRYPLTMYFDGPDHDVDAEWFFEACKERGPWIVNHPTKGILRLQLVGVTEDIQPVESGNVTVISSEWIEPLDSTPLPSTVESSAAVLDLVDTVNELAVEQFDEAVNIADPGALVAFQNACAGISDLVTDTLGPLKQRVAEVNATVASVRKGITDTLGGSLLEVVSLGGQLQALVSTPALATEDIFTRLNYYGALINNLAGFSSAPSGKGGRNRVAVHELVLTGAMTSMAKAVVDPTATGATNRETALSFATTIADSFATVTTVLDAGQAAYADSPIDQQHISQSQAFTALAQLTAQVIAFLLRQSYDLATARRFILTRERAPIEIALTEGMDFDAFLAANSLKGNDIMLLPAGRQVVVYL